MKLFSTKSKNIHAEVLADSISEAGVRITTFRLHYPRYIHSEFMTHRMFSRNASSSRAIPIAKMIDYIESNPAIPFEWGKNRPGMQSHDIITPEDIRLATDLWKESCESTIGYARQLEELMLHKQYTNRLLEPYQHMNVICTATEFDNFFHLRRHKDAQPEIYELADVMYRLSLESEPKTLYKGEWHTPFVEQKRVGDELHYGEFGTDIESALLTSASCCAQVSYRKTDNSFEKAKKLYNLLVLSTPVHASPLEHQATPIVSDDMEQDGVTHMDRQKRLWSSNFRGWIQNRQLVNGHYCEKYET